VKTDERGEYVIVGLSPAVYDLRVEMQGFKMRDVRDVNLAQASARFDTTLDLGTVTETLTVSASQSTGGAMNSQNAMRYDAAKALREAEEERRTAPSANVSSLQRRVAGVLPVEIEVPRAGTSHRFVRPLVLDDETTLSFRYKAR